ncbi:unnamed protein product [Staurois parvus]|uniref:Secreted protein n=1 Tax=Staurois parvus TaxID=386267 RepID=A0ABN9EE33_9NEOB|nr:unnamed protein product [Staurois parvus]
MQRCSGIPRSLTLSCTLAMSLLQCPRQCNPADAGICHLGSVPCERRDVQGDGTAGNLKMTKSDIHQNH